MLQRMPPSRANDRGKQTKLFDRVTINITPSELKPFYDDVASKDLTWHVTSCHDGDASAQAMLILSQLVVVHAASQSEEFWSCAGDGAFWHSFRETEAWQHSLVLIVELACLPGWS